MGKIFYIMGKSASGKDKLYSRLAGNKGLNLKKLILYTTRPVRDGEENGKQVGNDTPRHIDALLEACRRIKPRAVMLYSIDRPTPCRTLHKVEREELERIADRFREEGIEVQGN